MRWSWTFGIVLVIAVAGEATAGPPFFTDDPEPVDYRHWEFYLSSTQEWRGNDLDAAAPLVEVNYGALPDVQLHVVAPVGYVRAGGSRMYGYSDTEIGAKYRFVHETGDAPQVGVFPLIELPTGNSGANLGHGRIQAYLPVWIQKSWGKLTTYGGGGFWYNPGPDSRNWAYAGWEVQYDFSDLFTMGGEAYYHTPDSPDGSRGSGFAVGGFLNLSEQHHILFSLGHSASGENTTTGYLGYQITI